MFSLDETSDIIPLDIIPLDGLPSNGRAVAKSHNQSIEVDWETRGLGDGEIKLNFR